MIESGRDYDIYFVDWQMPGIDGIELSRLINEIKKDEPVIIMISSVQWHDIATAAKDAGIKGFLPKPIFPSDVITCINNCFGVDILNESSRNKSNNIDSFWGYRVLLVEDIEINREIVMALLEPTLVDIDSAENGAEALQMYSEDPENYNIIFMDIQMPVMDGYEATQKIRAFEADKEINIPIIAMTANVFMEDVNHCLEAGMDDHLGKPLDFDAVLGILRRHLFRQRPAKERRREDRRKSTGDRRQGYERRKGDRRARD